VTITLLTSRSALLSAGVVVIATALAMTAVHAGAASTTDTADTQPAIEEPGDYPNADQIFAQRGIRLLKGDGRILLVDCGNRTDVVVVESRIRPKPGGDFCFHVRAARGYVKLSLPKAYFIRGDGTHVLDAAVTIGDETEVVKVKKDGYTPIGETSDPEERPGTLVELRVSN